MRRRELLRAAGPAALGASGWAWTDRLLAAQAQAEPDPSRGGLPRRDFEPPAAGSYALPRIQRAADGWVLDGNWLPQRLSGYTRGKLTLLSFIYTYCADPQGCPLAYEAFLAVRELARADPQLRGQVRWVSLSFDPRNDTPDAMRRYGGELARDRTLPWHFLTTYSLRFLRPILDGFGQDVAIETDDRGQPTRAYTHLLKVFLIDRQGWVREIYSAAFLQPEVMANDLRTVLLDDRS